MTDALRELLHVVQPGRHDFALGDHGVLAWAETGPGRSRLFVDDGTDTGSYEADPPTADCRWMGFVCGDKLAVLSEVERGAVWSVVVLDVEGVKGEALVVAEEVRVIHSHSTRAERRRTSLTLEVLDDGEVLPRLQSLDLSLNDDGSVTTTLRPGPDWRRLASGLADFSSVRDWTFARGRLRGWVQIGAEGDARAVRVGDAGCSIVRACLPPESETFRLVAVMPRHALVVEQAGADRSALWRVEGGASAPVVASAEADISRVATSAAGRLLFSDVGVAEPRSVAHARDVALLLRRAEGAAGGPVRGVAVRSDSLLARRDDGERAPIMYRVGSRSGHVLETPVFPELSSIPASRKPIELPLGTGASSVGFLTLPRAARAPVPTVLLIHGGTISADRAGFDPEAMWIASLGFACVQVNFRGSEGQGELVRRGADGRWPEAILDDLTCAIDALGATTDLADTGRMAAVGWSLGGSHAIQLAARNRSIKAIAALLGVLNMPRYLRNVPTRRHEEACRSARQYGSVTHDHDRLSRESPIGVASSVRCPVLLVQGAKDRYTSVADGRHVAAAVAANGQPVRHIVFERERHSVRDPANRRVVYHELEQLLVRHLGGNDRPGVDLGRPTARVDRIDRRTPA